MNNSAVYQIVTDAILARLAQGEIPWRKPWEGGLAGAPRNFVSKKLYRGVNVWLLSTIYQTPFWLTYKQASEMGAQVRKGEKSSVVVFWSILRKKDKVSGEEKKVFLLRYYRVFNVEQIDGISPEKIDALKLEVGITPAEEPTEFSPIEAAQAIIDGYKDAPKTVYGGNEAVYSPSLDVVRLPEKSSFKGAEEFYSTAFHEYAHSTGHATRLNRDGIAKNGGRFGSEPYSKEELVAEFTASYLSGVAGTLQPILENSAAYIQNWSKKLSSDPKLFVGAASQAQHAAEYILHGKEEEHAQEEAEAAHA